MSLLRKHLPAFLFILLLAGLGLRSMLHPGLYTAHDIWHQVARLYHYSTLVLAGDFPPRWVFDLAQGFGYPLFFFSYHFPWFFGTALVLLGLSIATTLKTLFALCFITSGLSMYWLSYTISKKRIASSVAAVIYMWSPYFFLTLYVSAAIGTAFFFALLPILVLGIYFLARRKYLLGCVLLSTTLAAAVLTHVLTLTLLLPFLLIIWLFNFITSKKRSTFVVWSLISALLAIGLSAFYLLPLYTYLPLIKASTKSGGLTNNYDHYFVTLKQLVYSPWGFGPIVSDAKMGDISFQIGIAQWLGSLFSLVLLIAAYLFAKKKIFSRFFSTGKQRLIFLYAGLLLLSILLMIDVSKTFWLTWTKLFPLDFPFRLLLMSVFSGSMLIGLSLASIKKKWLLFLLATGLLITAIYTNRNHVRVNLYTQIPLTLYIASETTTNTFHEYLPRSADASVLNKDLQSFIPKFPKWVLSEQKQPTGIKAKIDSPEKKDVTIRQFSFPGVVAKVNGKISAKQADSKGKIIVPIPAGKSQITLQYKKPKLVLISEYISLFSLAILALLVLLRKKLS